MVGDVLCWGFKWHCVSSNFAWFLLVAIQRFDLLDFKWLTVSSFYHIFDKSIDFFSFLLRDSRLHQLFYLQQIFRIWRVLLNCEVECKWPKCNEYVSKWKWQENSSYIPGRKWKWIHQNGEVESIYQDGQMQWWQ